MSKKRLCIINFVGLSNIVVLVLEAFSLQRSDWVIRLNISNFYEVDRMLHSSSINLP